MSKQNIRRMKFGSNALVGTLLLLVALLALNYIAERSRLRLDLTRTKEWTVAPATGSILKALKSQVNVTVYATSEGTPPAWTEQRNQLRDLLTEYRSLSNGKVRFSFVDPSKDPAIERKAQENQIRRQLMAQESAKELNAREGYLGFTVEYSGKTEVVGVISPNHPLEYQLTLAINKIAQVSIPKIGFISPATNQYMGEPSRYQVVQQVFMQEGYNMQAMQATDLRSLTKEDAPEMVLIMEPENYTDEQLFYIDQYVMNGGKIFAATSSYAPKAMDQQQQQQMAMMGTPPVASTLNPILDSYGLRVNEDMVEDWGNGVTMMVRTQRGAVPLVYPLVFRVTDISKETSATDNLGVLAFSHASSISQTDKAVTGTVTMLARSSTKTLRQEGNLAIDPQRFLTRPKNNDPNMRSFDILAMAQGKLNSRYATVADDALPVVTDDDGTTAVALRENIRVESAPGATVIVAGSTEAFSDETAQQSITNALLLLNLTDMATRQGEMISLRGKMGQPARLRADITPAQKDVAQWLVIGAVPVCLIIIGIGAAAYGRMRRRRFAYIYGNKND